MSIRNQLQKPTWVSKYNAGVSTVILTILIPLLLKVYDIGVENAKISERLEMMQSVTFDIKADANNLRMDAKETRGMVNSHETMIAELKAILPNKNQFDIKKR